MLLTVDVGNTNTVLGLFAGDSDKLLAHWRVTTHKTQTVDEYGVLFRNLFAMRDFSATHVKHIVISSVVPPLDSTLRSVSEQYFDCTPLFIEPGVRTGMRLLVDNPSEVGADRVVNCIAAYHRFQQSCIVVDFGTATTFDVVSSKGEFLGGAIAPGLGISADALFSRAARLGRIDLKKPEKAIGTNTVTNLQSGMFFGYLGLVDGILERMSAELAAQQIQPVIVATGGLAALMAPESRFIAEVDDMLTLQGLRLVFERNVERVNERQPDRARPTKGN